MSRQFMLGTMFSAALAVTASAQSASQSPTEQQDKTGNRNDAAQTVTLSGCLKSADDSSTTAASPTANPDAATKPAAAGGFILADASPSTGAMASTTPSPADNPAATPPTNPTGTTGSTGKSYRLSGSTSDFSTLVGKRVEVKGTLQNRSGSGTGAAAGGNYPSNPAGAQAGASKATTMPQLRVTSVREVPGTCSSEGK
jgi:hypothetical protein